MDAQTHNHFTDYIQRVLNGSTYLYCPNHKRLERATGYVPSKGYRLVCQCIRTTAIGRSEPPPEFLFANREPFSLAISKD
jgi:hypothetical protein